jgi:ABC-type dipeptide/oligopeptide/nickel transport system permease component
VIAYALRRLLWIPLILIATFTVAFALVRVQPGGPFRPTDARTRDLACDPRGAFVAQLAGAAVTWARLDVDTCTGRARDGTPVLTLLRSSAVHTVKLAALALALAVCGGVLGGVLTARPRSLRGERVAVAAIAVGEALPAFALAVFALLVFALGLGLVTPAHPTGLELLVPGAALAGTFAATQARIIRAGLASQNAAGARRAALARGVSPTAAWASSLRLAILPVLGSLGATSSALVMGAIAVEVVFGIPGLGALFVDAARRADSNVLLGGALAFAALLLASNFLLDLLYAAIDPRVRRPR